MQRRAEKDAAVSALLQKILAAELEVGDLKSRQEQAGFASIGVNGAVANGPIEITVGLPAVESLAVE